MKKFLSIALAAAMCMAMSIPAFAVVNRDLYAGDAEYESSKSTLTTNGYTYRYWASLYQGTSFRAATYIQVTNGDTPANSIQLKAGLYNESGDLLKETEWVTNRVATNLEYTATGKYAADAAYSRGQVAIKERDGSFTTHTTTKTATVSRAAETQLLQTLGKDGQYLRNINGETYGSELLSDVVGQSPDLIAAVGNNDVHGYIRAEDRMTLLNRDMDLNARILAAAEDRDIPLYDRDGRVIGTFTIEGVEDLQVHLLRQLDNGQYPVNAKGETYGPEDAREITGTEPDLVSAVATNGVKGYIRQTERRRMNGSLFDADWDRSALKTLSVPVYEADGETVVGQFNIDRFVPTAEDLQFIQDKFNLR